MKIHALLTCLLPMAASAQSMPPTITLEIPVEAAGHSFQLLDDYYGQSPAFVGAPFYDALTQKFLVSGIQPSGWTYWTVPTLFDDTLGAGWVLGGNVTEDSHFSVSLFADGRIGHAVNEDRLGHVFALVVPSQGWSFPVSSTGLLGSSVQDSDGNWQFVSLGFFNTFVQTYDSNLSAANTALVDLSANRQAVVGQTDLRAGGWGVRTLFPTRAVTFLLGPVDWQYSIPTGYSYTLHTSSGSLQNVEPQLVYNSDISQYEVRVSGQAGIGETVWLTNHAGAADSTPHYYVAPGASEVILGGSPFSPPTQNVQTVTFSIGQNHFDDTFTVVQNGNPLTVSRTSWWANMLTTWTQSGAPVEYYYDHYSASVDLNLPWDLVAVNTATNFGQVTQLLDGFTLWNPVPPTGSFGVAVPHSRRTSLNSGQIFLKGVDGTQWLVTSSIPPAQGDVYYTYWSGSFIGTPLERWSYFNYIPASAPVSTTALQEVALFDAATGDTTSYGEGIYGGDGESLDFSRWNPVIPLTLNLPASRWSQNLSIITAAGGVFPIVKGNMQGVWSAGWFTNYGYFDATSQMHAGVDWWVYNPDGNNGALDLSDVNGDNLMSWNAPATDSDNDGLPDWYEYILGTDSNNTDTDGDGISDYAEAAAGTDPSSAKPVLTVTAPIGAVWLN